MQSTRYCAQWVVPVTSGPIADGAVLVVDGRIAEVGPRANVPLPDDARDIDLGGAALLPGLVNVHAHPELSVLRGALEDLPFHEWIPRLRRLKHLAACDADDWRDAARWSLAEAAAAGITTLGATEDSDAALHALRDAGMRGIAYREVFAPSTADAHAALRGLRDSVDVMRALETDLVSVGVSPHSPYTVSDALFAAVAQFALAEKLRVAVHVAESETEQQLVTAGDGFFAASLRARGIDTPRRGDSTVDVLRRAGLLELAPLLIHCVRISALDIAAIAAAGARIAHCPTANARLGHGIAPIADALDAGVITGLGSDSVASNNRMDMIEEARTAQLMQRVAQQSPSVLPPRTLLRLATIDGARALGLEQQIGSLDIGKDADLCAITLDRVHAQPVYDPVAAVFLAGRGSDCVLTVVRGRAIYENGVHTTLDVSRLRGRMDTLAARIRAAATSAD